jgi:hypothetical protein
MGVGYTGLPKGDAHAARSDSSKSIGSAADSVFPYGYSAAKRGIFIFGCAMVACPGFFASCS